MTRLRVRGGLVVTPEGAVERDVIVADERIEALIDRSVEATAEAELDASGLVVLPGAVDGHIHFVVDDTDLVRARPVRGRRVRGGRPSGGRRWGHDDRRDAAGPAAHHRRAALRAKA